MTDGITVFAIVDAPESDVDEVRTAVFRLTRQSITEPGCLRYEVYYSQKEPVRLVIHETSADESSLELHRHSSHVAEFKAALKCTAGSVWASKCLPENESYLWAPLR